MFDSDNLLTPIVNNTNTETQLSESQLIINFLNQLEGWKTKCKNLHWAAPKQNIHIYLDDFLEELSKYQDALAEESMGINGKMAPNAIKGITCEVLNASDFINEIKSKTLQFYDRIPNETVYKGVSSECESFIHTINKFKYLFSLCDIRPY